MDPAIVIPCRVIAQHFKLWKDPSVDQSRLTVAWLKCRSHLLELPPHQRWRNARGPLAVTILTVEQLSWKAECPDRWVDPSEVIWQISIEPIDHH